MVGGNILPMTGFSYSLGSTGLPWKDLYVSTGTIYVGTGTIRGNNAGDINVNNTCYVQSSGNVGINTNNPVYKLQVEGSGNK